MQVKTNKIALNDNQKKKIEDKFNAYNRKACNY